MSKPKQTRRRTFYLVGHDRHATPLYGGDAWLPNGRRNGRLYRSAEWGNSPSAEDALLFSCKANAEAWLNATPGRRGTMKSYPVEINICDIPKATDGRRSFILFDRKTKRYGIKFGLMPEFPPETTPDYWLAARFATKLEARHALLFWQKHGASHRAEVVKISN